MDEGRVSFWMMDIEFYDVVGTVGVATVVLMYLLLQLQKISSDNLAYSALNALGATLILFSLYFRFNFSAFLIELFWLAISLLGLFLSIRRRRRSEPTPR